jgi:hypothetical protein
MDITNAYRLARVSGVVASGQRRFVPRASTTVNYKFAPLGAGNGGKQKILS